jgi:hypothetical protein
MQSSFPSRDVGNFLPSAEEFTDTDTELRLQAARFVSNDDLKIDCHESGVYFWVMDC